MTFTGVLMLLITATIFVPSKISRKKRVVNEILHVAAYPTAACNILKVIERVNIGLEIGFTGLLSGQISKIAYF